MHADQSVLHLPRAPVSLSFKHLSPHGLRGLLSDDGLTDIGSVDSLSLLNTAIAKTTSSNSINSWEVRNGKVSWQHSCLRNIEQQPCLQIMRHQSTCISRTLLQGAFPDRVIPRMFTFAGELYLYGGIESSSFFDPGPDKALYSACEPYIVRLDSKAGVWQPLSQAGLPQDCFTAFQMFASGLSQHRDVLHHVIRLSCYCANFASCSPNIIL